MLLSFRGFHNQEVLGRTHQKLTGVFCPLSLTCKTSDLLGISTELNLCEDLFLQIKRMRYGDR